MSTDQEGPVGPEEPLSAPEPTRYGVRVEVDPAVLSEREIGTFDVADTDGNLAVVRLKESLHRTSSEGVQAASYSFSRQAAGRFPPPKIWSLLSVFSGAFLVSLFVAGLLYPELNLGIPTWVYSVTLGAIFLVSTAMEFRRVAQFIVLSVGFQSIEELEKHYGRSPIIDLPAGRLAEVRAKVEEAVKPLLQSRIGFSPAESATEAQGLAQQKGSVHGELS